MFNRQKVLDHRGREAVFGDLLKSSSMGCDLKNKGNLALFDAEQYAKDWPGGGVSGVVLMALDNEVFDAALELSATGGAVLNVDTQTIGKHAELFLISFVHGLGDEVDVVNIGARTHAYTAKLSSEQGIKNRPGEGPNGRSTPVTHRLDIDGLNYLSSTKLRGAGVYVGKRAHSLGLAYQHDTSTRGTPNVQLNEIKSKCSTPGSYTPNPLNMSNKKRTSAKTQNNLAECKTVPIGMREPCNASSSYTPAHACDMVREGSTMGEYRVVFEVFRFLSSIVL